MGDAAGSAAKLLYEAEKNRELVKTQALHSQLLANLASGRNADNLSILSRIANSASLEKSAVEPSQRYKQKLWLQWVSYASPSLTIRDIQAEWEDYRSFMGDSLPKHKCGDTDSMFARVDLGYYPMDPITMVHRENPIVFPDPVLLSDYDRDIVDSHGTDAVQFYPTISKLLKHAESRGLDRSQAVELLMQFVGKYFKGYAASVGNITDENDKVKALLGLMSYSAIKSRVMAGLIKMERTVEEDITATAKKLRSSIEELLVLDCMDLSKEQMERTIDTEASILLKHFMLPATHQQLKEYTRARLRHDNVRIEFEEKVDKVAELESRHATLRLTETLSLRRADFSMSLYFSQVAGEVQSDLEIRDSDYGPEAYESEYCLDPDSMCFNTGYEEDSSECLEQSRIVTEDGLEFCQHEGEAVVFYNGEYCYATEADIKGARVEYSSPPVPSAPAYQPRYSPAPGRGRGNNFNKMVGRPLPSLPSSSVPSQRGGMAGTFNRSREGFASGAYSRPGSGQTTPRVSGSSGFDPTRPRSDTGLPVIKSGFSGVRAGAGGRGASHAFRQPVSAGPSNDWVQRLPVANIDRSDRANAKKNSARRSFKGDRKASTVRASLSSKISGRKKDHKPNVSTDTCKRCGKKCKRDVFNSCPIYGLIKLSPVPCSNCTLAKITAYHSTDMCHASTSEAAMFYEDHAETDTEEDSEEEPLN